MYWLPTEQAAAGGSSWSVGKRIRLVAANVTEKAHGWYWTGARAVCGGEFKHSDLHICLDWSFFGYQKKRRARRGPLVQEAGLVRGPLSAAAAPLTAESGFSMLAIFKERCVQLRILLK